MGPRHETRCSHSLPFGVERTADRLLPPGARLADGPGCPPDRGRPMSGARSPPPLRARTGCDGVARPPPQPRGQRPSSPAAGRLRPAGRPTATLSPWWTDQASSSWEPPVGWGRAPSPSRWADAWRQPGLPRCRGPRPGRRGARGHRRCGAPSGPALGRPAGGPRPGTVPTCSSRPCPSTTDATSSRCAAGDHRGHRSARCSTCSGRSRPVGLGWSSTFPVSSALLPVLLVRGPLVVVLVSLTTRGLADADAVVQRLHDAPDDPGVDRDPDVAYPRRPDLRLVTRGGRGGAAVVDDVVAHLGVPHVAHLRHDAAVARDVERGLFPGTNRNAVRRCADAVAAVVDDVATAS